MPASVSEVAGLGTLTWVYPSGLVDRVVAACGRGEPRRRLLPARLVVYFVLGLAVLAGTVSRGDAASGRGPARCGSARRLAYSSLFRARQRLGPEPLRVLFAATANRWPPKRHRGRSGGVCG
ncbi:transposase domain-containing protein [Streptomyces longisporoflavus]|uniref:Transposase domain-containing protein n=1 Tax=Streptomyces longisporoflavus TaxID=28044 RepID=A0ABW7R2S1_9ACTN